MRIMPEINKVKSILIDMGFNVYQASVLATLLHVGETKATTLSKISKVPSARIYGVLGELIKMGLVVVRPGRPALYSPVSPEDIANSIVSWKLDEMRKKLKSVESLSKKFLSEASKIYLKGRKGLARKPLIRILNVGEFSEEETKKLYDESDNEILIISQAFEYYPRVSENLIKAVDRGVETRIILKNPKGLTVDERRKQKIIASKITEDMDRNISIKYADDVPLRGCIIDPEENGRALFLVEEKGVPYEFREAALTENLSLVKALALLFNLLWSSSKEFS